MSYEDVARIPETLVRARALREGISEPAITPPEPAFAVLAAAPGVTPAIDLPIDEEVPPEPDWLADAPPLEPWADVATGELAEVVEAAPPAPTPRPVPVATPDADVPAAILDPVPPDADQLTLF
jgi:hypothetical protein